MKSLDTIFLSFFFRFLCSYFTNLLFRCVMFLIQTKKMCNVFTVDYSDGFQTVREDLGEEEGLGQKWRKETEMNLMHSFYTIYMETHQKETHHRWGEDTRKPKHSSPRHGGCVNTLRRCTTTPSRNTTMWTSTRKSHWRPSHADPPYGLWVWCHSFQTHRDTLSKGYIMSLTHRRRWHHDPAALQLQVCRDILVTLI